MNEAISQTLKALKRSSFRSKFTLRDKELAYIREKGIETIREHARDFITSRVSPQFPKNDGKQTPTKGHPVFIAQHATATCCRGCTEKWHGIRKGRPLTAKEVRFLAELIMSWIEREMD